MSWIMIMQEVVPGDVENPCTALHGDESAKIMERRMIHWA